MKVPDRWLKYTESGRINGTRFVAFKVPLKEGYCRHLTPEESFTPEKFMRLYPKVKLVIDLTFTKKYYNGIQEFKEKGVEYVKLPCKGRVNPSEDIFTQFVSIVDEFIAKNPKDYLIGVHCTHGVNRTGYLIVRYMIERLCYTPDKALNDFSLSRGHGVERTNFLEDLKQRMPPKRL